MDPGNKSRDDTVDMTKECAMGQCAATLMSTLRLAVFLCLVAAPARAQAPAAPDGQGIRILVRTTLVALNHANRTGNYTVLRDLGAPGFRNANSAARLGQIFAELRQRNLDLGPVTVIEPKLQRDPFIDKQGFLRVTGFFPSRPVQINFDLVWQHSGGRWMLFGISVNPAAVKAPTSQTRPEKPQ
jgi:hypothetical protein